MYCHFTDRDVETSIASSSTGLYFHYTSTINGRTYSFLINENFDIENNEYLLQTKHLFKALRLNLKWPKNLNIMINDENDLKRIISEANPPISPKQKLEYLFLYIQDCQIYDGQRMSYASLLAAKDPEFFYLREVSEINFYLNTLVAQGYLNKYGHEGSGPTEYELTFEGLQFGIKLREEGQLSNNCFIAMSFNDELIPIREAIKKVCASNGFNPILIDEQKIDFDQTINDAIIANIKKSKFCIADFTQQKNGVYFEAGYALGRGLPVIYLCSNDDFKNLHFDTNHFPHIKYNSMDHMVKLLDDRIKAWILK